MRHALLHHTIDVVAVGSIALIVALVGFTFTTCSSVPAPDKQQIATGVAELLKPTLSQVKGLSPELVTADTSAVADAIAGKLSGPPGGFDWNGPLWAAISLVLSYLGINARRDQLRITRGEPVGHQPAVALAPPHGTSYQIT